jgi:quercetin dioxygenase-like cupin family protein
MKIYKCGEMRTKDDRPGMKAAIVHGVGLSLTRWEMQKGADLPDHSHPHAQITLVVSGSIRFRPDSEEPYTAVAGDYLIFEPNERHGGEALEDTVAVDAFSPAREDFKAELGWQD